MLKLRNFPEPSRLNIFTKHMKGFSSMKIIVFLKLQEFMLCRNELNDARKCLDEGKAVTNCSLEFFRKVKKSCFREFTDYYNCIDKSSPGYELEP